MPFYFTSRERGGAYSVSVWPYRKHVIVQSCSCPDWIQLGWIW